jgi:hypothetical protein
VDGGNGEPCAAIAADKRVIAVMERRCIVTEAKKGTEKGGKRSMSSTKKGKKMGKEGKRKKAADAVEPLEPPSQIFIPLKILCASWAGGHLGWLRLD